MSLRQGMGIDAIAEHLTVLYIASLGLKWNPVEIEKQEEENRPALLFEHLRMARETIEKILHEDVFYSGAVGWRETYLQGYNSDWKWNDNNFYGRDVIPTDCFGARDVRRVEEKVITAATQMKMKMEIQTADVIGDKE
jgi:hypothetical protein